MQPDKNIKTKCIICTSPILPYDNDSGYEMCLDGIVSTIYAPFGSDFDGDTFQIGICDECISMSLLKENLHFLYNSLYSDQYKQSKEDIIFYLIKKLLKLDLLEISDDKLVDAVEINKVIGYFGSEFHFDYDLLNYSEIKTLKDLIKVVYEYIKKSNLC